MSSPWIFICPSSRGIGHALTRRLLQTTSLPILATARRDTSGVKSSLLQDLPKADDLAPRLSIVECDVTDEASMSAAAKRAAELFPSKTHHLRLACAIPGLLQPEKNPKQVNAEESLEQFRINAVGPLLLIKHFSEFLPKQATDLKPSPDDDQIKLPDHATWLSMSARVGSVTDNKAGGWYSYRASKSAVMSISKSFDNFLRARSGDQALSIAYHPGTVKTELSRGFWEQAGNELFSPEYAAEKMVDVLSQLKKDQRGKCWDYKNSEVPP